MTRKIAPTRAERIWKAQGARSTPTAWPLWKRVSNHRVRPFRPQLLGGTMLNISVKRRLPHGVFWLIALAAQDGRPGLDLGLALDALLY